MKMVASMVRLLSLVPSDANDPASPLVPIVEVMLGVTEPEYGVGDDRLIKLTRVTSGTLRFFSTPDALSELADQLIDWAAEANVLGERVAGHDRRVAGDPQPADAADAAEAKTDAS